MWFVDVLIMFHQNHTKSHQSAIGAYDNVMDFPPPVSSCSISKRWDWKDPMWRASELWAFVGHLVKTRYTCIEQPASRSSPPERCGQ
jgi:hypothetical protein